MTEFKGDSFWFDELPCMIKASDCHLSLEGCSGLVFNQGGLLDAQITTAKCVDLQDLMKDVNAVGILMDWSVSNSVGSSLLKQCSKFYAYCFMQPSVSILELSSEVALSFARCEGTLMEFFRGVTFDVALVCWKFIKSVSIFIVAVVIFESSLVDLKIGMEGFYYF